MKSIAILDFLTLCAILAGIAVLLFTKKIKFKLDISLIAFVLLLVISVYVFFMLLEWSNITHAFESVEDITGALIPMMWAFLIYSIIQNNITADLTINKENLRITLKSIGDAVIATDVQGKINRMNLAAEVLTGWNFDEAKGKKADEVFSLLDANTRRKMNNPVEIVLETGKTVKITNQSLLIGKSQKEHYISDSAAPIFNDDQEICGAVLVFSDMTEHYKQAEKIKESEERLHLALIGAKAGLWDWFIPSGNVVYNDRWAEIIGSKLSELEPLTIQTWHKIVHPEDLIRMEELTEAHFKGKIDHIECENRIQHKSGHWVWIMVRGMVVERDKTGNPVRMTGTVIDISNQKETALKLKAQMDENIALNEEYISQNEELIESIDRIRKINEELNESKLNAEESYRLKSAFLANMSHEIRTPMNGIIGFSELLKDEKLHETKRKHFASIVIDSGKQLLNIVNDILDISRIETGRVSLLYEDVVINDLMNILHAFFEPQTGGKALKLSVLNSLDNTQSIIHTDKTRLRQVLTNLLNNAIKFTHEGHIKFGYRLTDGFMEFFVEDTGIGIPADLHEKIFEPFRQAEFEISHQYGGTGLGLTISRKLVELLGGRLWLQSSPAKGSVFYFTLPYDHPSDSKTNNIEEKSIPPKSFNMVVLVVEDDEINYLFLETILSKSRIKTIRALNGIEAIELCKTNPDIKLVLMDIKMPFMNGYEATRRIKQNHPELPVIAQTAYAMHEDRSKALEAGCDGYISKPIITSELLKLIEEYSDHKH